MERRTRGRRSIAVENSDAGQTSTAGRRGAAAVAAATTARNRSPVRRSSRSRPRSTVLGTAATSVAAPPSPIKEVTETKSPVKTQGNLPSTVTTNTATRAPNKLTTTSHTHSSYSSTTQRTIEIRSSSGYGNTDEKFSKIADYLRRSLSKSISSVGGDRREGTHTPTPSNTDAGSRYSRSVSRSVYDDDSKAEFSDNEMKDDYEDEAAEVGDEVYRSFIESHAKPFPTVSSNICRKIEAPREFGGWIGAVLLMLLVPCVVYYLQWTCSAVRNSDGACSFKPPNFKSIIDTKYLTQKVFVPQVVGVYIAYIFGIVVLSAVLIGRGVRLPRDRWEVEYKFNALSIALVVTIAGGVAEFYEYRVADYLLKHYLRFSIFGFLCAFVVALGCYFRADVLKQTSSLRLSRNETTQVNPYGKTGKFIVDFALGRQINPKWLGFLEYKQVFYRAALIATLLFAEAFIYKNVQFAKLPEDLSFKESPLSVLQFYAINVKYDAPALLAAVLLLFYVIDAIIFEHHLASSFELQGEGFGCLLLIRYAATPYLLSAVAKFFFERRVPNAPVSCQFAIYVAFGLLFAGLALKRFSSAIKYQYRLNPLNPYFAEIESVHTYQGRRLLLGSLWGRLRQPNYAGDILALCAVGVPIFLRFAWPPVIGLVLLIALLLHRAVRVNERNLATYHSSWGRYCSQVRYYVLPKVF